jgi:hypothetical protein
MKALITIGLLSFFIAAFAQSPNKFELIDLFDIEYVSDPQISSDGKYIAHLGFDDLKQMYQVTKAYVMDIHGGPLENYGPRFSAELQLYAA